MSVHLAQLDIGRMPASLDSPAMAEFVRAHGETAQAFSFKRVFAPDSVWP